MVIMDYTQKGLASLYIEVLCYPVHFSGLGDLPAKSKPSRFLGYTIPVSLGMKRGSTFSLHSRPLVAHSCMHLTSVGPSVSNSTFYVCTCDVRLTIITLLGCAREGKLDDTVRKPHCVRL